MLAPVVRLNRSTPQARPVELALPQPSEHLLEAERKYDESAAELATARIDDANLTENFRVMGLKRADGTAFPPTPDGRYAALAEIGFRISDLEVAKEAARRNVTEARRTFAESVARQLKPHVDNIAEEALSHIERAESLVGLLAGLAAEAKKSNIHVANRQMDRAANIAQRLYTIRGELAPTPDLRSR